MAPNGTNSKLSKMASCAIKHARTDKEFPDCTKAELDIAIKENSQLIVIATQPDCPHCAQVKPIVDSVGVPYYEILNASPSCSDLRESLGIDNIPEMIIYANGKQRRYSPAGKYDYQIKRDLIRLVNS